MTVRTLDPYATLGIAPNASRDEAGRAHRRLAKAFHPDVNPGVAAADRMRRINEAWRILSDPVRRARYDANRAGVHRPAPAYGPRAGAATWTTWPEARSGHGPRTRRPPRPAAAEPSFGDRPAVVMTVWIGLSFLLFIGTWLGSLAR
jgi:curved DNA-binding protein CbpA